MRRCSPCTSSASGYSHYELHRRLVDSSSVSSVGSTASRCRAGPHERVGVTAKHQKECAFSTTEDHLPWHGMGLALMQARLSPARIEWRLTFFRESRGMGNKIAMNYVIGTGQEKFLSGVGGTGNSNDTQLYTQIYLLYK